MQIIQKIKWLEVREKIDSIDPVVCYCLHLENLRASTVLVGKKTILLVAIHSRAAAIEQLC